MRKYDLLLCVGDSILCICSLISVLTGSASTNDYVTLYFTISILIGLIARAICTAKRKNPSDETHGDSSHNK